MPWQEKLVLVLAHFLWQGAIVAGLLAMLTTMLRVRRPSSRYAASLFAFVAMATCPIATWFFAQGRNRIPALETRVVRVEGRGNSHLERNITEAVTSLKEHNELRESSPQESHANDTDSAFGDSVESTLPPQSSAVVIADGVETNYRTRPRSNVFGSVARFANWIVAVWLTGVSLLNLNLGIGTVGTWLWKQNVDLPSESLKERLRKLCEAMSMSVPRLRVSRRVTEALVVGLFRPMVLLPAVWVTELPMDMLEAVLAHELAHLRRFDLWVNFAQRIVEALLFYHPAVWWLSRRLRLERELCCDAVAARSTRDAVRYAETLEHVAHLVRMSAVPGLAIGMNASDGVLLRRVQQLLGSAPVPPRHGAWFAGMFTFVVALSVAIGTFVDRRAEDNRKDDAMEVVEPSRNDTAEGSAQTNTEKSSVPFQTVEEAPRHDRAVAILKKPDEFRDLLNEAIKVAGDRILIANRHSPWQISQCILAMRRESQLLLGDEKVNAIEWLSTTEPQFDGEPWLLLTPDGARFQPYINPSINKKSNFEGRPLARLKHTTEQWLYKNKKYYFEGHPGQFLAHLSESDLPKEHEFHVEGKIVKLSDIINDSMREVDTKGELSWVLWGLQHYLDPNATWINRKNEEWSIERLVQIEVNSPIIGAPCGGTIRLFALTRARDTYLRTGGELHGVWKQADQRISQFIEIAQSLQNADGSFSADYFKSRSRTDDINSFFGTTGDTMEFLSIALPDARLNEQWVRKAVWKLSRELIDHQKDQVLWGPHQVRWGPLFHSLNALLRYRERIDATVAAAEHTTQVQPENHLVDIKSENSPNTKQTTAEREFVLVDSEGRSVPNLMALKRLLAASGKSDIEPIPVLDDVGRGKATKRSFVKLIETPHGRITVVGCKVVPRDTPQLDQTNLEKLPEAAFVFDSQGGLIARLGGEIAKTEAGEPDSVDVINLGSEEDWFVRVLRSEANGQFDSKTELYRIANPVIPSMRYLHYANANAWSNWPKSKPRFGTIYFDFNENVVANNQKTSSIEAPERPQPETKFLLDQPVSRLVIEGNTTIPDSEIAKHIIIRAGRPVTQAQIKDDVDALVRLRWFYHVEPRFRQTDDGLVLCFVVLERPVLKRVEYKGLRSFKRRIFDKLTQLIPGNSPFDIGSNREAARRIEEFYHDKGFAVATVELEKGNDRNDREVAFLINEGPGIHNSNASSDGNKQFSSDKAGTTNPRVYGIRELTWDGDRNRFGGVAVPLVDDRPHYQVDTAWSRDFEALTPWEIQLVIASDASDLDHWHRWEFAVPDKCEAIVRVFMTEQNGETKTFEKTLPAAIHSFQIQVKPKADSAGTALALKCDNETPVTFDLPNQFEQPVAYRSPFVQVVDPGFPVRILERAGKASKASLKVEIESRLAGAR